MKLMSLKAVASGLFLAVGMAIGTSASALSLNTTALKANSTLQLSADAFAALEGANVSFSTLGNAYAGAGTVIDDVLVPSYILPVTEAAVSIGWNLKLSPTSGEASGSALSIKRGSNSFALANFNIDYASEQVFADVIIKGVTTNMAVYSFDPQSDLKIGLSGLSLTLNQTLGNLQLTTQATDTFASALKLSAPLKSALGGLDFGTIKIDIATSLRKPVSDTAFTAAMMVPEPSTYALMALGMVGIAAVARRKQA